MKANSGNFLRLVGNRFLRDSNGPISVWEEYILSLTEKAKQKDGRLVMHIIKNGKQYLTENTACFHVLGRTMSDILHAGQETG